MVSRVLVKDLLNDQTKTLKAISELKQQIQGEAQIESMINNVQSQWDVTELEFTKNGFVCKIDRIQHQCLEDISNLAMIEKSQYSHNYTTRIKELTLQANEIFTLLEDIRTLQKQWIELGAVFKTESVQKMLSTEFTSFTSSNATLNVLYEKLRSTSLIRNIIDIPNLKMIVEECQSTFRFCTSSLFIFLRSQRERLPSLFNLGDNDLLGLLAVDNLRDVNAWIPQLFEGLAHIKFEAESAIALLSKNGEEIVFNEPVSLNQGVIDFLIEIGACLTNSIKESVLPCYESMVLMTFQESKATHQIVWMCFQAALQTSTRIDYLLEMAKSVLHPGLKVLLVSRSVQIPDWF